MQEDFHYYATYCAAYLAGYNHKESIDIAYTAQFVDCCTRNFLATIGGPLSAATTQQQMELMDSDKNIHGFQNITRIWSSFHFLPYDLYADVKAVSRRYKEKYRLICNTNGDLLVDTVNLARGGSLAAAGVAMHVLADTWAHRYFAGTPSMVINNTDNYFYELLPDGDGFKEVPIVFSHNPASAEDTDKSHFVASPKQLNENAIMNLGHGRAGHLPDYSFIRYKYMPAWANYKVFLKDNPSDYLHAFCQMIYALKYLKGTIDTFEKDTYDFEAIHEYEDRIKQILSIRRVNANEDWKAFGEELSGMPVEAFDVNKYKDEYINSPQDKKDNTFLGNFFNAAMAQKSMVTNRIYKSGNRLAGISIDYDENSRSGISDFRKLAMKKKEAGNE